MTFVTRLALLVALVTAAPLALAIEAGQIDDFEDGTTMGWREGGTSPNSPTNESSGGPQGANDNWLRDVSSGGGGAGSRMVMFNTAQWTGDYNTEEIESIRVWVRNLGNTAMQIRIALESGGTWFSSTNGFALPANGNWQQATFELNSNNMTRVQGSASLSAVLDSVTEMRILSASMPNFRGDAISATLGVDNIEAVGSQPPEPLPQDFLDVVSLADVDGDNHTDLGVLRFDPNTGKTGLSVLSGRTGNRIRTVNYGSLEARSFGLVTDANGDLVPEYGVVVVGSSLLAKVKDAVNNALVGQPKFSDKFDTVAFLAVGDAGGGAGPDVAVVGREAATGKVLTVVKDVASGDLVKRIPFNKNFVPFAAVAVDNVGDSPAMEIAVLGIAANGKVQTQVKDALTGNLVAQFTFAKQFTPLFFTAVHDDNGELTYLTVLGRDSRGVVQAQTKRASDGGLVKKVGFSKTYVPAAFMSFPDSNNSGGGEIVVVGVNAKGQVLAVAKETVDGTVVSKISFSSKFPPLTTIAVNGVAGTGRNEIAVFGQKANGDQRLVIKDLLTGDLVISIPMPD